VRVLVTGSSGFIGGHTVDALRDNDHTVRGCDKKDGSGWDLTIPGIAATVMGGCEMVVHLAATCSTPGSVTDPMTTFRDTVVSAVNVLDAARVGGIPVVLVTSVKARDGMTPYGAAKRMVELWAEEYRSAYQFPVTVVRPGTVYGPGQEGSPDSGWIAWFLKAKEENHPVVISGAGDQTRDLLHVTDMARLLTRMVEHFGDFTGSTWDVGGGVKNAVTVHQMADYLGLDYTFGPPRYGDAASYIGKDSVPGWEPRIEWRDGINRLT